MPITVAPDARAPESATASGPAPITLVSVAASGAPSIVMRTCAPNAMVIVADGDGRLGDRLAVPASELLANAIEDLEETQAEQEAPPGQASCRPTRSQATTRSSGRSVATVEHRLNLHDREIGW